MLVSFHRAIPKVGLTASQHHPTRFGWLQGLHLLYEFRVFRGNRNRSLQSRNGVGNYLNSFNRDSSRIITSVSSNAWLTGNLNRFLPGIPS